MERHSLDLESRPRKAIICMLPLGRGREAYKSRTNLGRDEMSCLNPPFNATHWQATHKHVIADAV